MTGWQPIETAPKDGTAVLLYMADGKYAAAEFRTRNDGIAFWEIAHIETTGASICLLAKATHWQPLPAPPESAT